ncbi:alpha-2-macroglobulin-like [Symphorus nematophorus]
MCGCPCIWLRHRPYRRSSKVLAFSKASQWRVATESEAIWDIRVVDDQAAGPARAEDCANFRSSDQTLAKIGWEKIKNIFFIEKSLQESGSTNVSFTVPDTITTLGTEAFCLSSQGVGLAPYKEITVSQPFFLELILPYSLIRREHFELKASVFNYLSSCIMITVTPAPSLDYTLTPLSGDQYTSCLCGRERKILSWTMAPSALDFMDPVIQQSLSCLRESINDLNNTYTTALLAYVFTLAGDLETHARLLQHLDKVAIQEGAFLHWSQSATDTSASLSVEISSYVLLAKLSASPTAEDLGYAAHIVGWLTGQQTYDGGFSSTQDTVVAPQALALYSTLVFSPDSASTVTVQFPSGQLTFDVSQDNKLLYQEEALKDVTGKYSLEVKGSACASVQISLHYNIQTTTNGTTLSLEPRQKADCSRKYSGNYDSIEMLVIDIKMLSGFVSDPESLKKPRCVAPAVEVWGLQREQPRSVPGSRRSLPSGSAAEHPCDYAEAEYTYPCATGALSTTRHYMVTIPAVLESGAESKFCANLMQPNETLSMTVILISESDNVTLLEKTSDTGYHECVLFQVPAVGRDEVWKMEVKVQGDTFHSEEVRKVMIKVYGPMTFIQSDKPIYLPGQTVHFRVVTLDTMLRPANGMYDIIELLDAHSNRIGQWLNQTSHGKILQLSHPLISEAREGIYQIFVWTGEKKITHNFKVEKYVLPKFEVTVKTSDEVSIEQEEIEAEICAKYTYGQPVPGIVTVEMCRPIERYYYGSVLSVDDPEGALEISPPCYTQTKEMDKTGCVNVTFKMSTFTKLEKKILRDSLHLKVHMEEEGTGIKYPQEKGIAISYVAGRLSFVDMAKIYEQGSVLAGKVRAVYYNDTPIPDMPVYLFDGRHWSAHLVENLTTDSSGFATFSYDTANHKNNIQLHASTKPQLGQQGHRVPYYEEAEHTMSVAERPSEDTKTISSVEVQKIDSTLHCGNEQEITIHYVIVGEAEGTVELVHLVLARGVILMQGVQQVEVKDRPVNEGEMAFRLTVSPEMAPVIQVVAYAILPSERMIAHSADFEVEKCFAHKVSLEFSPTSAVPGEDVRLQMTAEPDSLCGVSAIDHSVVIKEPGKTLTADTIFGLLPVTKVSHIPYELEDPLGCLPVRPKRYVLPYHHDDSSDDAHAVFQNVGLKVATNLMMRLHSCLKYRGREYWHRYRHYGERVYDSVPMLTRLHVVGMAGPGAGGSSGGYGGSAPPIETVRTFFPETWIWDLVEVGDTGKKGVPVTVPDTITTWETEAFCLSPSGFSLAPREEITVFQPFFLELSLPYSIIRGESFELKATVFNYMSSCIMVSVTSGSTSDYTLTTIPDQEYKSCLCGNERKTFSWTMNPSALGVMNVTVKAEAETSAVTCNNEIVSVPERGRIDVVTKSLIVKAEGTEVSKNHNWLFCPQGDSIKLEGDIPPPENMIPGSAHATLSVLGDIMGRAMKNLDGLLQMPYGCGEQNMALLAPNIYILEYLKNTGQLTPDVNEKAITFLTSGYQRQLNYKDSSGAYSTFGSGPGNTWLTAFVVRSFTKAKEFIYIDPEKIEESKNWLVRKQQENGCFEQSGRLFNNRMKGGVSDEVTLSAYVTAALLETGKSANDPVIRQSLSCLRESVNDLNNTYTTALLAYVFTLAGDLETRAYLLQHLDKVAIQEGAFLHWSQSATDTSASLSVEISSYVLLAKLSASSTAEDLGYAARIVRWLTGQQNHYGGFFSTQDTVVALQALVRYSLLVYSPEGESTVTVQSASDHLTFEVNQANKLLYQEEVVKEVSGKYNLEVNGSTCVSMQISLRYNIPTPTHATTLSVTVKTEPDCGERPKLTLKLRSLFTGKESNTNMVILDIKMLSGFVPEPESLKKLKGALLVKRVSQVEDHVLIYLAELEKDIPINHSLDLIQQHPVNNLKAAVVKIYDYYQPSDEAKTEYSYVCTSG